MGWRRVALAASCVTLFACGGRMPPGQPQDGQVISGFERFGWDQPAADAAELATFRYAIYLDSARLEAEAVTCESAAVTAFSCTCRLPSMSAGAHTLAVAAYVVDGGVTRESPRSASVRVIRR